MSWPRLVAAVIVGVRTLRDTERNAATSGRGPPSDDQLAVLARHRWERDPYTPA